QPEEDQRAGRLRPDGRGAGADRGAAQRREPSLPRGQAGQACAQAAPQGSPLRRTGARRVTEEHWPGEDRISATEEGDLGTEAEAEADGQPAPPEEQLEAEEAEEAEDAEQRRDGDTPAPDDEPPAEEDELPRLRGPGHAPGQLSVPDGYGTLTGSSDGARQAASGLQLAALETGVPVSFGVLTLESAEQADERVGKGAEAVRTALEMADLFSQLRASATA